jgi:hypothetical protein
MTDIILGQTDIIKCQKQVSDWNEIAEFFLLLKQLTGI